MYACWVIQYFEIQQMYDLAIKFHEARQFFFLAHYQSLWEAVRDADS